MAILTRLGLIALALFILLLDRFTPIGHAVWLGYYVVIIIASFVVDRKWLLWLSIICSIFIIVGFHISKASPTPVVFAVENRASSIGVLWILTYALYRNRILTMSLQQRTEALMLANRDLESFGYSVSHDLKNPLVVIMGLGQFLLDTASGKLDESEKESLGHLLSESSRMSDIISDLLRLSRIGRQELKIESVNLSDIAADCMERQKRMMAPKEISFSIQPGMTDQGDRGLLQVLFDNLIGNAVKFSSKTNKPRIEIGCKCVNIHDHELVYFVQDNGVGFDMSKAVKLFAPFTRLHSPKDFSGTGIGLSIARKIIERHGGKIWAESEVGKGATFYFTIQKNALKIPRSNFPFI
jgi:light-regulated signal transduction histidine kinase (bacteriophytochrome)